MEKFRQFGNACAESPWWHPLSGSWFVFYGENNAPFKLLCRARDGFFANQVILKSCLLLLVALKFLKQI